MRREKYVLAAYSVHRPRALQHAEYVTLPGLSRGLKMAMERDADYVFVRRIRPEAEGSG